MNFLQKLFRRKATFIKPHRLSLQAMYDRDIVRPEYTIPQNPAELMDLHRNVYRMYAIIAPTAEDIIYRSANLEILKRAAFSLYAEQDIAPTVYNRIMQNVKGWEPKPVQKSPKLICKMFKQLAFNF